MPSDLISLVNGQVGMSLLGDIWQLADIFCEYRKDMGVMDASGTPKLIIIFCFVYDESYLA